jgi:hypothetical protein
VEVLINTFFEKRVGHLLDLAEHVETAFASAGLDYRVVGGLLPIGTWKKPIRTLDE